MYTVNDEGEIVVVNDIRNAAFEVYSEIGPSYQSQKDKQRSEIVQMLQSLQPGTDEYQLFMLKYMELMDGLDTKDVRDYARKKLIMSGLKEPETDEEKAMVQQAMQAAAAQGQQPDPMLIAAQSEMIDAQTRAQREQRETIETIADIENDKANTAINAYKAQTERYKAGAEVELRTIDQAGKVYKSLADDLRVTLNPQMA